MKNKKIKKYQDCKGITLTTLIITIILILILAGVTVIIEDAGLFDESKKTVAKTNNRIVDEQEEVNLVFEEIKNELKGENIDNSEIDTGEDPSTSVERPTIQAAQRATTNSVYSDGINTAIIPPGFTVSGLSKENVIEKGLVIYLIPEGETVDWTNASEVRTAQTKYDQFVWIPISRENINEMYMCQREDGTKSCRITVKKTNGEEVAYCTTHSSTEMAGRLYEQYNEKYEYIPNLTTQIYSATSSYPTEPMTSESDDLRFLNAILECNYDTLDNFYVDLQKEYNDIVKSVYQNQGFYVGRYEAGGRAAGYFDKKLKVVAGAKAIDEMCEYEDFYGMSKYYAKDLGLNVGSTMIQGAAYDQLLKFVETDEYNVNEPGNVGHGQLTSDGKIYVNNYETGGRNYNAYTICKEVQYKDYSKNVYDLEGSISVFTMTRGCKGDRIYRGGTTDITSSCASMTREKAINDVGMLLQLYIIEKTDEVTEKIEETNEKYFDFIYDETAKTAILTGIKAQYQPEKGKIYIKDGENKITKIIIPSSTKKDGVSYAITGIGNEAFKISEELTSEISYFRIPKSVNSIAEAAFYGCDNIKYIIIPPNVLTIGKSAFEYCSSLDAVICMSNGTTRPPCEPEYNIKDLTSRLVEMKGIEVGDSAFANTALEAESCIAEGTLITLANGTQLPVEELTGKENLLVWNHLTGQYEGAPIAYIINHGNVSSKKEIIHAYFSDGTDIEIIKDHGFYDLDLNKYIYLEKANYSEFMGHWFVKQSKQNTWEKIQLIDVIVEEKTTVAYEVVTYKNLTCFTNGLLSISSLLNPFCNMFEFDENTLSYDKEKMEKDIETHGLFTYKDFEGKIPEYAFELYNVKYLKVALGKGQINKENIEFLIDFYNKEISPLIKEK